MCRVDPCYQTIRPSSLQTEFLDRGKFAPPAVKNMRFTFSSLHPIYPTHISQKARDMGHPQGHPLFLFLQDFSAA